MLDINLLRQQPDVVKQALVTRGHDVSDIDRCQTLDVECRILRQQIERQRAARRALGERGRETSVGVSIREEARAINQQLKTLEETLERAEHELHRLLLSTPNIPHDSVPVGADSLSNHEVRRWREPVLPIEIPKPHWDVGARIGLDIERGVKLAGSRFYTLFGHAALLNRALAQFMLDLHVRRHGYVPVYVPHAVTAAVMEGCGQLPKFADGLYHDERDDLYFIPTAESALAGLHRAETLNAGDLPLRYVSLTPCFRREAGAAGIDTRGILRVHQFDKVELFAYTTPEASYDELERIVENAETVLRELEIPYRVMLLSTGDMGFAAAKTYDIEVWLPSQREYREISSCSNVEAFQARRGEIRYRPAGGGKPRHVHMLNGSGLAVGRTMIAVLENYQRADGSVIVPEALRPYMFGLSQLDPVDEQRAARLVADSVKVVSA
jgi:seryl-tRNA synthetase